MKNKHKMIITAVFAIILTFTGLDVGISGLIAGYGASYLAGALVVPLLLWVGTVRFYEEYKKEEKTVHASSGRSE